MTEVTSRWLFDKLCRVICPGLFRSILYAKCSSFVTVVFYCVWVLHIYRKKLLFYRVHHKPPAWLWASPLAHEVTFLTSSSKKLRWRNSQVTTEHKYAHFFPNYNNDNTWNLMLCFLCNLWKKGLGRNEGQNKAYRVNFTV